MEVTSKGLLLLDLDGVVVFESGPPLLEALEILRLHEAIVDRLVRFGVPVVIVTHRSKAEARRILSSAGIEPQHLAGIMAAEDLAWAAFRYGNILRLFSRGLRKSLILPLVEHRHGIARDRIALLDDRLDNIEDLLANGLGLAMLAPSEVAAGNLLVTFDIGEAIETFLDWQAGGRPGVLHRLAPAITSVAPWRRTGHTTTREGRHLFNLLRTGARHVRWGVERIVGRS